MNFKKTLLVILSSSSIILSGCGLIQEVNTGYVKNDSDYAISFFDEYTDVKINSSEGVITKQVRVTTPIKESNISGKNIPDDKLASWYTFYIEGCNELSDIYACDINGNFINNGLLDNIAIGHIYKIENEKYGVLIPNGYGKTIADEEGNIYLTGDDVNIRIGNTIFTEKR